MKSILIDRTRRLRDDPGTGHNRWHPDIEPLLEVAPGEDLLLETRDAADGQVKPGMTFDDLARNDKKAGHPLTGPIFVKGAQPGDILEVESGDVSIRSRINNKVVARVLGEQEKHLAQFCVL